MKNSSISFICRGLFAALVLMSLFAPVCAQYIVLDVPDGATATLPVPIGGPTGVIINENGATTGTQILTGGGPATANVYTGNTLVEGGTLQAGTASGTGNALSSTSDFVLSNASTVDLNGNNETIASLASADGTTVVTNSGNGPATLTINDTASSLNPATYTYAGAITDAGAGNTLALVKTGTGTLVLSGANTFAGGTRISGGTLAVGGAGLGAGNVTNAARLETTASLGGGAVNAQVGGNFTQLAAGTLRLQVVSTPVAVPPINGGVAGTSYDTFSVNGTATLAGTLNLNFGVATVPRQGQQFVVLRAGAPLTTTFGRTAVTNLPRKFIAVTTYNDVYGGVLGLTVPTNSVVVTLVRAFTSFVGLTPNQQSVASAVDADLVQLNNRGLLSPRGNTRDFVNNIVSGLTVASYRPNNLGSALDQLSPQRFDIFRNIAFDNYALDLQSLDNVFARERYGRGGIDTAGFSVIDHTLGNTLSQVKGRLLAWQPAPQHGLLSDSSETWLGGVKMTDPKDIKEMKPVEAVNRWNGFIDGGVDLGDLEHNADTQHASYTSGRVRAGADFAIAKHVRIGAMFGYSHTDADLDHEGSKATVSSYTPGLYATYANPNGFYANAVVSGTLNEYSTERRVVIPGVNRTASGSTDGGQFGVNLDGGYDFHRGDWTFGPALGLTYGHLGVDNFTENGAQAANLHIQDWNTESLRSRVGGTVRYRGQLGRVVVTPHVSAFWQHEFLNSDSQLTSTFDGLPQNSFSVRLPDGDPDNALLDFGLDAEICDNVTLFVDYATEAGGDTFFGQQASGGVKVSF